MQLEKIQNTFFSQAQKTWNEVSYCLKKAGSIYKKQAACALQLALITNKFFKRDYKQAAILSLGFSSYLYYIKDDLLKALLSYPSWMKSPQTTLTKVHLAAIKLLSFGKTNTFDYQNSLPNLPVASLNKTIERYLASIKPVLSTAEYQRTKQSALEFIQNDGKEVHKMLSYHAWGNRNWLEKWWEEFAYLRSRDSLVTSTNWYGTDHLEQAKLEKILNGSLDPQVDRAAQVISAALSFHQKIENESLKPLTIQNTLPFCMDGFKRLFGTTRIPGIEKDTLKTTQSNHAIILVNGHIFKLNLFRNIPEEKTPLTLYEIKTQIEKIKNQALQKDGDHLSLLTTEKRENWALLREGLIKDQKESIEAIEDALFVVSLSDQSPEDLETHSRTAFLETKNRWFDKSVQLVVFENGKIGGNLEHSWGDATIPSELLVYILDHEAKKQVSFKQELEAPKEILFPLSSTVKQAIKEAQEKIDQKTQDYDLKILKFSDYGKSLIKNHRLSPDGWIQMAIQLAYYKLTGRLDLTYESASTRFFYHGRTETIRVVSSASKQFVEVMQKKNHWQKKQEALKNAIELHVKRKKQAMSGEGIDRHIMGLRVIDSYLEKNSPFLKDPSINLPYKLATSQTPCPNHNGGGFSPLVEDGYGISYAVHPNHITFHITSKKSAETTSSTAFKRAIEESLQEMKELYSTKGSSSVKSDPIA